MANVFQATTGYRDPMKAMTLKALEERAKSAQDQMATAMKPQVVADPLQGVAGLMDVLGAGMNQRRVDQAAATGRADLAAAMAGINMDTGPNMEQIAQIAVRDPELAQKMYSEAMANRQAMRMQDDAQAFTAGESKLERDARAEQERLQRELTQSESALGRTHDVTMQEDRQAAEVEAAKELARQQRRQAAVEAGYKMDTPASITAAVENGFISPDEATVELSALDDRRAAETTKAQNEARTSGITDDNAAKIMAAYNNNEYGTVGSPEAIKIRDEQLAGAAKRGTPTPGPGSKYAGTGEEEAAKQHREILASANNAAEFNANIERLSQLGAAVGTGKLTPLLTEAGAWLSAFGVDPRAIVNVPEAQAFQTIVDKLAPTMRAPGSGSSSDTDVKMFLNSLPSLSKDPEGNRIIVETFQAIQAAKIKAAQIIIDGNRQGKAWYDIDADIVKAVGNPYEQFRNSKFGRVSGTGGDATAAPAAGAGSPSIDDLIKQANEP